MRLCEQLSIIKDDQKLLIDFNESEVVIVGENKDAVLKMIKDIEKYAVIGIEIDEDIINISVAELTDLQLACLGCGGK